MKHWSQIKEKGGFIGLKATLLLYCLLGRRLTYLIMYEVMVHYFLFHRKARKASIDYLKHLYPKKSILSLWILSFRHFCSFGKMLIDKLAVWNHSITIDDINFSAETKSRLENAIRSGKGGLIFTAHFGHLEVARALSKHEGDDMKINALVFSKHAQQLNDMLTKINPEYKIGMISLQKPAPDLAIQLCEKIEQGEFVVIVGDRTSVTQPGRNLKPNFLSEEAPLPQGAFILASLLQCPTYFMLCPKKGNKYDFIFEDFEQQGLKLNRKNRQQDLEKHAQKYANMLGRYCQEYPLQWFNFFDFWQESEVSNER